MASNNNNSSNKCISTTREWKKRATFSWDSEPVTSLEPIRLNGLRTVLGNALSSRYQFNWSTEDYSVVELYQPSCASAYEQWIKNGSDFMADQAKIAGSFADMKMEKISIADIDLAHKAQFEEIKASIPEPR